MEIFNIIKHRAEKFETENNKYNLHYLIGVDEHNNQVTEINGDNSYCNDCVDEVLKEYNKKLKETPYELDFNCTDEEFNNVKEILITEEGSPEKDDFCICENCHRLISTVNVLHTFTQEIDHWLESDVSIDLNDLKDEDCFILNELIENADYPELISQLKNKIKSDNQSQLCQYTVRNVNVVTRLIITKTCSNKATHYIQYRNWEAPFQPVIGYLCEEHLKIEINALRINDIKFTYGEIDGKEKET